MRPLDLPGWWGEIFENQAELGLDIEESDWTYRLLEAKIAIKPYTISANLVGFL